ncbi:MAG: hypothetical protein JNL80_03385 [Phycisphaerae bacterium]|jgi:hypothetical protein|nr:hypothetical protein [Phycisphaerae bacterium]
MMSTASNENLSPTLADELVLHDSRFAKQCLIAGAIGVLLAPFVIGFIPSAYGLHAGASHLRFRIGSRPVAITGLVLSGLGALISALASVAWGAALLSVLLQRSAIDQARQWAGVTPAAWSLTDLDGRIHDSAELKGSMVYIDLFSPLSDFSPPATERLGAFAAEHPEIRAISWCPECDSAEGDAYRFSTSSTLPIAVGGQSMPEPFSLMSAKPTIVVIDGEGRIRHVHPGLYTREDLVALLNAKTPEEPTLLGPRSPAGPPSPPVTPRQ